MSGADAIAHARSAAAADFERHLGAARSAYDAGDLAEARRLAQAVAEQSVAEGQDRRIARAHLLLADITRADGDLDVTERALRRALSSFSVLGQDAEVAATLAGLAEASGAAGRFAEAVELARQAVTRSRAGVRELVVLGRLQWRAGSPADALAHFDQALAAAPRSAQALAGRGQVRAELGEHGAALADLDRALAELPDDPELRSARALALAGLGRAEEARTQIAAALALAPGHRLVLLRQARIALLTGEPAPDPALLARLAEDPAAAPADRTSARRLLALL